MINFYNFKQFIKANKFRIAITIILIVVFNSFGLYIGAPYLCTQNCKDPNTLQKILYPFYSLLLKFFTFAAYVYDIFEKIGIYLFFDKKYISSNTYTLMPRFPNLISLYGTFIFNTLGMIISIFLYISIWYALVYLIHKLYKLTV